MTVLNISIIPVRDAPSLHLPFALMSFDQILASLHLFGSVTLGKKEFAHVLVNYKRKAMHYLIKTAKQLLVYFHGSLKFKWQCAQMTLCLKGGRDHFLALLGF